MTAPGPPALGRGVVVVAGEDVPAPWRDTPVVTVDEATLADPAATVACLHDAWAARQPVVVALGVDPALFRQPQSIDVEPWRLRADAEPWFDRLHFLVWANTYDARAGGPTWWWGVKAARLAGARAVVADGADGDVVLADGTAAWVDGGPRRPWAAHDVGGLPVVHAESVEHGRISVVAPPAPPAAELAPDQMAAVSHGPGPCRVVAPAGSGKTRVLTERLRHLHRDRGYEHALTVAVAYNKEAQREMEARTTDFGPRVQTLHALGLSVLRRHRGHLPTVLDERDVRRLIESLLPGRRPRRANTDPLGAYVEALATVRLGLVDPAAVEDSRDDVPGLAELFPRLRRQLHERGAIDFDEQIYGAVEVLLRDGAFRREQQGSCRHVLVDEFQDLTPAYVLLLRLLALPALDVFGVGDDDQTIYGHLGADPGFLIDYERLFPGAAAHPLTVNYRCPVDVVHGARTLLGYNQRRVPKQIEPGPANDRSAGALRVVEHAGDDGATTAVEVVRGWLEEPDVTPAAIAVLARVNSLLLAPHVALHVAGVRLDSVLRPTVLDERTGLRAALAYLRLAAGPDAMSAADVVEILRRPTRGLPQWFPDRLARRSRWTPGQVRAIAASVGDKDAAKVHRLADDLEVVAAAGRAGTTRDVLEVVRDDVGLGSAMGLLDRSGASQGNSHLDDLEGLLGVADLHPALEGFEAWLRAAFRPEGDPTGVTVSTIHRVKGREWDRVALFGVTGGIVPHRLADDEEEERRVLHVGITRGRHRVAVLTDRSRRSPFLDELAGTAARRPPRPAAAPPVLTGAAAARPPATGLEASLGRRVIVRGGFAGVVEDVDGDGAVVRTDAGGTLRVRFGERVEVDGQRQALRPPSELWGEAARAEGLLRAWRTKRSTADGVPAYIVLSDKHLRGIALARPTDPRGLAACEGIGPAKLERYGDDILAVVESLPDN